MKSILVTGAAGYIGSSLVGDLLKEGFRVCALDNLARGVQPLAQFAENPRFEFVLGDARDVRIMSSLVSRCDIIVPLAAVVSTSLCAREPDLAVSVNLQSIRELNKIRSSQQMVIFPNTNIGYGVKNKENIYTEESQLDSTSVYGRTKADAEIALLEKGNCIALRLASVFGPSLAMKNHLLLNYLVYKSITDKFIVVYQPKVSRNFLHIRDLSRCFLHCIERYEYMRDHIFNTGHDTAVTKGELAKKIADMVGNVYLHYADFAEDPENRDYIVSNDKLRASGFVAEIPFEDGIRGLIRYYSMFPPRYE